MALYVVFILCKENLKALGINRLQNQKIPLVTNWNKPGRDSRLKAFLTFAAFREIFTSDFASLISYKTLCGKAPKTHSL